MAYIYILQCADGRFYTGSTRNLNKRICDHMNGLGSNYTKKRLPVKLVYYEEVDNIGEAYRREKQIQKWSRKKKIALITGDFDKLVKLSKSNSKVNNGEK